MVSKFANTKRATFRRGRPENDGEHTLHLQFIAVVYASRYYPELDIGRVLLYALVHDFVEVYAGDVNSLKASPDDIVRQGLMEAEAIEKLAREFSGEWPFFIETIRQYELLETPEARFVKCFDKCDALIVHYHDKAGVALLKMGVVCSKDFERLHQAVGERLKRYEGEFPDVIAIREELVKRVAETTYSPV